VQAAGGPPCEIVIIKTSGDRLQEAPLSDIGGKRLFVKEIEDALIGGDIDLAVHSSKDMPALLPEGLDVAAVLEREDPRDALVLPIGPEPKAQSPEPPRIGTGSVRRIAQLRTRFPTAEFLNVRGNLDTRLRKLDGGDYDLLVLAAAGLRRLGFDECVPAPGQGIIAIEIRSDDAETRTAVARVNNHDASHALTAERALVTALGGGCQMPIGGIAVPVGAGELELLAIVSSLDGARMIRYKKMGPRTDAAALGRQVGEQLLKQGAADILGEALRHT
jgi:hydroxymethylbilane synthase